MVHHPTAGAMPPLPDLERAYPAVMVGRQLPSRQSLSMIPAATQRAWAAETLARTSDPVERERVANMAERLGQHVRAEALRAVIRPAASVHSPQPRG